MLRNKGVRLARATTVLKQLVNDYPGSPLKPPAVVILTLRSQANALNSVIKARGQAMRQLSFELESLKQIDADRGAGAMTSPRTQFALPMNTNCEAQVTTTSPVDGELLIWPLITPFPFPDNISHAISSSYSSSSPLLFGWVVPEQRETLEL
jgi:hypothetical protein